MQLSILMKKNYAIWHFKWLASCLFAILVLAVLVSLYFKSNNQSIILNIVDKVNAILQPESTNSETLSMSPEKIDISNLLVGPATGPLYVDPNNPRYFTDGSGKVVFLTGSHFWDNLQDSGTATDLPYAFDYSVWLDFLVNHNHNFFRLWTWEESKWVVESPAPYYWTPMPYQRTGPGTALDGKPKFDLTKFNQSYFDRMRSRIIEAGNRGIYVSIMLFDGWSIEYPKGSYASSSPWNGHPFNASNNINGINGDTNGDQSGSEVHTLTNPDVTAIQDAYVRKVIDTVNDLDNVLYEISNESPGNSQNWQYHMINLIKNYEATLPKQHPVGMTVEWPDGDNADLFASSADWISPNGDINNPPVANGSKVIIADTDHLCGICGDRYWVWKSFTRGENPLFMDQYDDSYKLEGGGYDMNNPNDVSLRLNLGYVRAYAQQINLAKMTPRPNLCSTGYCLANPVAVDAEYLVYAPNGGQITVNLSSTPGEITLEWFRPQNGNKYSGGTQIGGKIITVQPPFSGDAVLYLSNRQGSVTLTLSTSGSGSISPSPSGPYNYGDLVQLTAIPATGWHFDHWEGNLSGSSNPASITLDGDKSVTAVFLPIEYPYKTELPVILKNVEHLKFSLKNNIFYK